MKAILKIFIALIIVAGLCFGIYCILPETSKMFIKGNIQYKTDDVAKKNVDALKGNTICYTEIAANGTQKAVDSGVTYGAALEKTCKSTAWYYEEATNGSKTITFYGSKATFDMTKYNGEKVAVDLPLKVIFYFPEGGKSSVQIVLDGKNMSEEEKNIALQAIAYK